MKTAVITGATSERGIGMTVAQRYAREGWAVVVLLRKMRARQM